MSKLSDKTNSNSNITNMSLKFQPKIINYQEIISLNKILKPEIREVKGKDYTDAYIRILEKQYEKILEESLINANILKSYKNNKLFQKILNKNKIKTILRNESKNDFSSSNKSFTGSKIINSSRSISGISPIKKSPKKKLNKTNSTKNNSKSNSFYKSEYWEDYDFLKINKNNNYSNKKNDKILNKKDINEIEEKNTLEEEMSAKENKNDVNKESKLDNYYLYLLNLRKKKNEEMSVNEEKNNIEIMRRILEHIYNDDELLKKNLEDESIPDYYKRFIIQDELKKDNLFDNNFKLSYNETQKMIGPKISNGSRLICKNIINYEPINKRLNKVIKKKKNDIAQLKKNIEKSEKCSNTSRSNNNSEKKMEEWLIGMENWNKNKILKIKKKKEEIEKRKLFFSECRFKPLINKNAHLKKEDEGILFSDRLYYEYFTLRQKKDKLEKQKNNNFTFRPKINKALFFD